MKKKLFTAYPRKGEGKEILLKMKLTILLLIVGLVQVSAISYSQTTKLSLDLRNSQVAEVLREIETLSDFRFFYQREQVNVERVVNVNIKDMTVEQILNMLFPGDNIEYKIFADKLILIAPKYILDESSERSLQPSPITGTVTDDRGHPVIGASILIKGTTLGSITDLQGRYSITNVPQGGVLVFSFIGMRTEEVIVGEQTIVNVVLMQDLIGIDEVVVIGYGTQKKVNVIGSITQISTKDLTFAPVSAVSSMLAGRLPGAIFMQGSGNPGNDMAAIRVRGNATLGDNSPLVIIDGIAGRDINSLHSDDIESISVLKDASAAIYGSRAANGVILITTKRGSVNLPPTITYRYSHGIVSPTKITEMADAATYATMIREYQSYKETPEGSMRYSLEDIEKYRSGEYPWTHPNTDWFGEVFKDYTSSRNHGVSLTGGTSNISYYVSYGSQSDDALYRSNSTNYTRYNIKANIDIRINDFLSFAVDLTGIQENRHYPTYASATFGRTNLEHQLFDMATRFWPTSPAFWPNGKPGPDFERGLQPVVMCTDATGFEDEKRLRSNNVLSATFKFPWIEGLSVTAQYAYDLYNRRNKYFNKPWNLYYFDKDAYLAAGRTGREDGSDYLIESKVGVSEPFLIETFADSYNKAPRVKMDYRNTFNEVHNIDAFIAYEQNESDWETFAASRRYFLSDQLPYLFAGGDEQKTNSSSVGLDARMNYFGRFGYDYAGKYLFQFNLRRDGSLRFSKESGRWGTFPSVLLGWRMSSEGWWRNNLDFINNFKLKASWGQMGNDAVSAFQYLTKYGFSSGMIFGDDRTYEAGLSQTETPNPLITWEVANILNFGWESVIMNKFTFDTDFFYERRNNILVKRNASVPEFSGITLPDENFGIVDNYGFELVMGYTEHRGDFSYGINGNLNFARNKIIEFDEAENPIEWQIRTGKPQGALLLYKWIGIFRDQEHLDSYPHVTGAQPGDLILEDYNKDGKIDGADRQLFPLTSIPEITFGLNFNLKYKNWELGGLVQGHGRAWRRLDTNIQRGLAGNYFMRDAIGRWTPDHIDASRPRAFNWEDEYWRSDAYLSTYFYEDISFARLKNLQISYTLPSKVLNSVRAKDIQLYFSGQNLWVIWSAQDFTDPELNNVRTYPLMRILSFGGKISF